MRADLVVVGAGLFGATIARQAADELGIHVLVLDRRTHPGGNVWSTFDPDTGIEVHSYGSHIFHTSNEKIWQYANRFGSFNNYEHRVYANHAGQIYPLPINLGTINQFFRSAMGPTAARALITEQAAEISGEAQNLEEKAISLIGRPLYEAFIRGYTAKQWQTDPTELTASIITRLPVRMNYDNRYFSDIYQGVPTCGFGPWVEHILDSELITVQLETDFFDETQPWSKTSSVGNVPVVFSGALDQYFANCLGPLSWRTLDFETEVQPVEDYQGTAVVNYPDADVPFTRVHEFRHYNPERKYVDTATVIMREYSRFAKPGDERYYPVNTLRDRELLEQYRSLAQAEPQVLFGGRLGSYKYYDMHQVIASALHQFSAVVRPWFIQR